MLIVTSHTLIYSEILTISHRLWSCFVPTGVQCVKGGDPRKKLSYSFFGVSSVGDYRGSEFWSAAVTRKEETGCTRYVVEIKGMVLGWLQEA